jgi:hypothetical protein
MSDKIAATKKTAAQRWIDKKPHARGVKLKGKLS